MDAEFSSPLSESNSPAGLANGVQGNSYGPYSRKLVARGRSFLSRVTARVPGSYQVRTEETILGIPVGLIVKE